MSNRFDSFITKYYFAKVNLQWSNSTNGETHEESAAILKNGVLVFPSYKNNSTTVSLEKDYGYKFKDGNLVDPLDGKTKELVALVHTHPDKSGEASPSIWTYGGGSDYSFGKRHIPGKMNYVFGHDNYLRGIVSTNAGYSMYNRKEFNFIRVTDVLLGRKIDLRDNGLRFKYIPPKPNK